MFFLLTKSSKYYFNNEAIKEKAVTKDNIIRDRDSMRLNNVPGRSRMSGLKINNYDLRNKRSVWHLNNQPFRGVHFAVFPEKLVEPMILAGCPRDGIVLDPFAGSGTTCKVAKDLGRHYIGIELSEKYVNEIANKRLENVN